MTRKHPDGVEYQPIGPYGGKKQPYNIWFQGFICHFARTQEEADNRLEKLRASQYKRPRGITGIKIGG